MNFKFIKTKKEVNLFHVSIIFCILINMYYIKKRNTHVEYRNFILFTITSRL